MNSLPIVVVLAALALIIAPGASMADDYDCGTEQAAIRKRANELADDVDAKKVNDQNSCAYLEAAAQQAERQAAFMLNCYQGLRLTEQQAEDSSLLLGVSAKNMRRRCPQPK